MTIPSIEEVERYIDSNSSFFIDPFTNETAFMELYSTNQDALTTIKDYTDKLKALLFKHQQNLNDSISTPVMDAWRKNDFSPALEHEEIRNFIIENPHPAIQLWNEGLLKRSGFDDAIDQIERKAQDLKQVNRDAHDILHDLHEALQTEKSNFIIGKNSAEDFKKNCEGCIEKAQISHDGALHRHHGIFGKLFNLINIALNRITNRVVKVKPTDAIQKTQQMRKTLNAITRKGVERQDNVVVENLKSLEKRVAKDYETCIKTVNSLVNSNIIKAQNVYVYTPLSRDVYSAENQKEVPFGIHDLRDMENGGIAIIVDNDNQRLIGQLTNAGFYCHAKDWANEDGGQSVYVLSPWSPGSSLQKVEALPERLKANNTVQPDRIQNTIQADNNTIKDLRAMQQTIGSEFIKCTDAANELKGILPECADGIYVYHPVSRTVYNAAIEDIALSDSPYAIRGLDHIDNGGIAIQVNQSNEDLTSRLEAAGFELHRSFKDTRQSVYVLSPWSLSDNWKKIEDLPERLQEHSQGMKQ